MAGIEWSDEAVGYSDKVRDGIVRVFDGKLPWLDLEGCDLETIPPEIAQLPYLRELDLSSNRLRALPAWLFDRTDPLRLVLLGNRIEPEGLVHARRGRIMIDVATALRCHSHLDAQLVQLVVTDKDASPLGRHLPRLSNWCAHLDQLMLGARLLSLNQPRRAPSQAMFRLLESLPMFSRLTELSIRGLGIKEVPGAISQLDRLRSLSLDGMPGLTWPHWLWLGNLSLERLSLVGNKLDRMPAFISKIATLKAIYLNWNQLTEFPTGVLDLPDLEVLSLMSNRVTRIPAGILKLQRLQTLQIDGNSIATPPAEICDQGLDAIRDYWRQREEAGVDYLCEAKLIILGEAGAGKTTLARKIQDPGYTPNPSEPSTEGIDILRWQFPDGHPPPRRAGQGPAAAT